MQNGELNSVQEVILREHDLKCQWKIQIIQAPAESNVMCCDCIKKLKVKHAVSAAQKARHTNWSSTLSFLK